MDSSSSDPFLFTPAKNDACCGRKNYNVGPNSIVCSADVHPIPARFRTCDLSSYDSETGRVTDFNGINLMSKSRSEEQLPEAGIKYKKRQSRQRIKTVNSGEISRHLQNENIKKRNTFPKKSGLVKGEINAFRSSWGNVQSANLSYLSLENNDEFQTSNQSGVRLKTADIINKESNHFGHETLQAAGESFLESVEDANKKNESYKSDFTDGAIQFTENERTAFSASYVKQKTHTYDMWENQNLRDMLRMENESSENSPVKMNVLNLEEIQKKQNKKKIPEDDDELQILDVKTASDQSNSPKGQSTSQKKNPWKTTKPEKKGNNLLFRKSQALYCKLKHVELSSAQKSKLSGTRSKTPAAAKKAKASTSKSKPKNATTQGTISPDCDPSTNKAALTKPTGKSTPRKPRKAAPILSSPSNNTRKSTAAAKKKPEARAGTSKKAPAKAAPRNRKKLEVEQLSDDDGYKPRGSRLSASCIINQIMTLSSDSESTRISSVSQLTYRNTPVEIPDCIRGDEDVVCFIPPRRVRVPEKVCRTVPIFLKYLSATTWNLLPRQMKLKLLKLLPDFSHLRRGKRRINNTIEKMESLKLLFSKKPIRFEFNQRIEFGEKVITGFYSPSLSHVRHKIKKIRGRMDKLWNRDYVRGVFVACLKSRAILVADANALAAGEVLRLPRAQRTTLRKSKQQIAQELREHRKRLTYYYELRKINRHVGQPDDVSGDDEIPDFHPPLFNDEQEAALSQLEDLYIQEFEEPVISTEQEDGIDLSNLVVDTVDPYQFNEDELVVRVKENKIKDTQRPIYELGEVPHNVRKLFDGCNRQMKKTVHRLYRNYTNDRSAVGRYKYKIFRHRINYAARSQKRRSTVKRAKQTPVIAEQVCKTDEKNTKYSRPSNQDIENQQEEVDNLKQQDAFRKIELFAAPEVSREEDFAMSFDEEMPDFNVDPMAAEFISDTADLPPYSPSMLDGMTYDFSQNGESNVQNNVFMGTEEPEINSLLQHSPEPSPNFLNDDFVVDDDPFDLNISESDPFVIDDLILHSQPVTDENDLEQIPRFTPLYSSSSHPDEAKVELDSTPILEEEVIEFERRRELKEQAELFKLASSRDSDSGEENSDEPKVPTESMIEEYPELQHNIHSCFFSLLKDIICSDSDYRMDLLTMEKRVEIWCNHPESYFNSWFDEAPWMYILQNAVVYLAGLCQSSLLPEEYVPFMEYKPILDIFQWIGAGRDSDMRLAELNELWFNNKKGLNDIAHVDDLLGNSDKGSKKESELSSLLQCYFNSKTKLSAASAAARENFREQETKRFLEPNSPFIYCYLNMRTIVGPVDMNFSPTKEELPNLGSSVLVKKRPAFLSITGLVQDAVARLPRGEGTHEDIVRLLKDSQFIRKNIRDATLYGPVSYALERLQYAIDPCVKRKSKQWKYIHRGRTLNQFRCLYPSLKATWQLSSDYSQMSNESRIRKKYNETGLRVGPDSEKEKPNKVETTKPENNQMKSSNISSVLENKKEDITQDLNSCTSKTEAACVSVITSVPSKKDFSQLIKPEILDMQNNSTPNDFSRLMEPPAYCMKNESITSPLSKSMPSNLSSPSDGTLNDNVPETNELENFVNDVEYFAEYLPDTFTSQLSGNDNKNIAHEEIRTQDNMANTNNIGTFYSWLPINITQSRVDESNLKANHFGLNESIVGCTPENTRQSVISICENRNASSITGTYDPKLNYNLKLTTEASKSDTTTKSNLNLQRRQRKTTQNSTLKTQVPENTGPLFPNTNLNTNFNSFAAEVYNENNQFVDQCDTSEVNLCQSSAVKKRRRVSKSKSSNKNTYAPVLSPDNSSGELPNMEFLQRQQRQMEQLLALHIDDSFDNVRGKQTVFNESMTDKAGSTRKRYPRRTVNRKQLIKQQEEMLNETLKKHQNELAIMKSEANAKEKIMPMKDIMSVIRETPNLYNSQISSLSTLDSQIISTQSIPTFTGPTTTKRPRTTQYQYNRSISTPSPLMSTHVQQPIVRAESNLSAYESTRKLVDDDESFLFTSGLSNQQYAEYASLNDPLSDPLISAPTTTQFMSNTSSMPPPSLFYDHMAADDDLLSPNVDVARDLSFDEQEKSCSAIDPTRQTEIFELSSASSGSSTPSHCDEPSQLRQHLLGLSTSTFQNVSSAAPRSVIRKRTSKVSDLSPQEHLANTLQPHVINSNETQLLQNIMPPSSPKRMRKIACRRPRKTKGSCLITKDLPDSLAYRTVAILVKEEQSSTPDKEFPNQLYLTKTDYEKICQFQIDDTPVEELRFILCVDVTNNYKVLQLSIRIKDELIEKLKEHSALLLSKLTTPESVKVLKELLGICPNKNVLQIGYKFGGYKNQHFESVSEYKSSAKLQNSLTEMVRNIIFELTKITTSDQPTSDQMEIVECNETTENKSQNSAEVPDKNDKSDVNVDDKSLNRIIGSPEADAEEQQIKIDEAAQVKVVLEPDLRMSCDPADEPPKEIVAQRTDEPESGNTAPNGQQIVLLKPNVPNPQHVLMLFSDYERLYHQVQQLPQGSNNQPLSLTSGSPNKQSVIILKPDEATALVQSNQNQSLLQKTVIVPSTFQEIDVSESSAEEACEEPSTKRIKLLELPQDKKETNLQQITVPRSNIQLICHQPAGKPIKSLQDVKELNRQQVAVPRSNVHVICHQPPQKPNELIGNQQLLRHTTELNSHDVDKPVSQPQTSCNAMLPSNMQTESTLLNPQNFSIEDSDERNIVLVKSGANLFRPTHIHIAQKSDHNINDTNSAPEKQRNVIQTSGSGISVLQTQNSSTSSVGNKIRPSVIKMIQRNEPTTNSSANRSNTSNNVVSLKIVPMAHIAVTTVVSPVQLNSPVSVTSSVNMTQISTLSAGTSVPNLGNTGSTSQFEKIPVIMSNCGSLKNQTIISTTVATKPIQINSLAIATSTIVTQQSQLTTTGAFVPAHLNTVNSSGRSSQFAKIPVIMNSGQLKYHQAVLSTTTTTASGQLNFSITTCAGVTQNSVINTGTPVSNALNTVSNSGRASHSVVISKFDPTKNQRLISITTPTTTVQRLISITTPTTTVQVNYPFSVTTSLNVTQNSKIITGTPVAIVNTVHSAGRTVQSEKNPIMISKFDPSKHQALQRLSSVGQIRILTPSATTLQKIVVSNANTTAVCTVVPSNSTYQISSTSSTDVSRPHGIIVNRPINQSPISALNRPNPETLIINRDISQVQPNDGSTARLSHLQVMMQPPANAATVSTSCPPLICVGNYDPQSKSVTNVPTIIVDPSDAKGNVKSGNKPNSQVIYINQPISIKDIELMTSVLLREHANSAGNVTPQSSGQTVNSSSAQTVTADRLVSQIPTSNNALPEQTSFGRRLSVQTESAPTTNASKTPTVIVNKPITQIQQVRLHDVSNAAETKVNLNSTIKMQPQQMSFRNLSSSLIKPNVSIESNTPFINQTMSMDKQEVSMKTFDPELSSSSVSTVVSQGIGSPSDSPHFQKVCVKDSADSVILQTTPCAPPVYSNRSCIQNQTNTTSGHQLNNRPDIQSGDVSFMNSPHLNTTTANIPVSQSISGMHINMPYPHTQPNLTRDRVHQKSTNTRQRTSAANKNKSQPKSVPGKAKATRFQTQAASTTANTSYPRLHTNAFQFQSCLRPVGTEYLRAAASQKGTNTKSVISQQTSSTTGLISNPITISRPLSETDLSLIRGSPQSVMVNIPASQQTTLTSTGQMLKLGVSNKPITKSSTSEQTSREQTTRQEISSITGLSSYQISAAPATRTISQQNTLAAVGLGQPTLQTTSSIMGQNSQLDISRQGMSLVMGLPSLSTSGNRKGAQTLTSSTTGRTSQLVTSNYSVPQQSKLIRPTYQSEISKQNEPTILEGLPLQLVSACEQNPHEAVLSAKDPSLQNNASRKLKPQQTSPFPAMTQQSTLSMMGLSQSVVNDKRFLQQTASSSRRSKSRSVTNSTPLIVETSSQSNETSTSITSVSDEIFQSNTANKSRVPRRVVSGHSVTVCKPSITTNLGSSSHVVENNRKLRQQNVLQSRPVSQYTDAQSVTVNKLMPQQSTSSAAKLSQSIMINKEMSASSFANKSVSQPTILTSQATIVNKPTCQPAASANPLLLSLINKPSSSATSMQSTLNETLSVKPRSIIVSKREIICPKGTMAATQTVTPSSSTPVSSVTKKPVPGLHIISKFMPVFKKNANLPAGSVDTPEASKAPLIPVTKP